MKQISFFSAIILSLIFITAKPQTHKLDSLFSLLTKAKSDTNHIKLLLKIGNQYENSKPDSAIFFYEKAFYLDLH